VAPDVAAETARERRDRVRRERAQAAAELDTLTAEDDEVEAALAAITEQVSAQQEALGVAEAQVERAQEAAAEALNAEAEMTARVDLLEDALRVMAVQEYITGGRRELDAMNPEDLGLNDWVRRNALADIALGTATATAEQLEEAREDLTVARRRAEQAEREIEKHRDELADQLTMLTVARDQQAVFAAKLDARIESRLAEAAALAQLDQQLSAQIAAEQAALAARNAGRRAGSSGSSPVGRVPLATVRGITVHADLADNLEALLSAADADGVSLSGWGYRDPQQQQALREAHCPDPEDSPAASCRPPTARPGHSMHERGLAIDFTQNGRVLSSGTSGYRWLRAHAATYGLRNLPGEPWHWSTNGR